LAAISFDQKMIRRRQSQQHHCWVCAGLWAHTERVCGHGHRAWMARASPLPGPRGPPRGLGDGGALLRRPRRAVAPSSGYHSSAY